MTGRDLFEMWLKHYPEGMPWTDHKSDRYHESWDNLAADLTEKYATEKPQRVRLTREEALDVAKQITMMKMLGAEAFLDIFTKLINA
jgi:hypothetical protein